MRRSIAQLPRTISFWNLNGPYMCFSRIHVHPFEAEGITWPTVEHYYQAHKTLDLGLREEMSRIGSAVDVRVIGHEIALREGWDDLRYPTMLQAYTLKFSQSRKWKKVLLSTMGSDLKEASYHPFWGRTGQNMLGLVLQEVRDNLYKKNK